MPCNFIHRRAVQALELNVPLEAIGSHCSVRLVVKGLVLTERINVAINEHLLIVLVFSSRNTVRHSGLHSYEHDDMSYLDQ